MRMLRVSFVLPFYFLLTVVLSNTFLILLKPFLSFCFIFLPFFLSFFLSFFYKICLTIIQSSHLPIFLSLFLFHSILSDRSFSLTFNIPPYIFLPIFLLLFPWVLFTSLHFYYITLPGLKHTLLSDSYT